MDIKFDIKDNASPAFKKAISDFPNTTRGALKSTGYWLVGKVKEPGPFRQEITSNAPGGKRYAPFGNQKFRQALDRVVQGRGKTNYQPYGKLKNALRYRYTPSSSRGSAVTVGFISSSAYNLAKKLSTGFSSSMTEARRNLWNAAFERLGWKTRASKTRTSVDVPARPAVDPMWQKYKQPAMQKFEETFRKYLMNDMRNGKV